MKKLIPLILCIGYIIFTSCKKDLFCEGCADNNKLPIANAGPDQSYYWRTNTINLDGVGTDADGYLIVYKWYKLSGSAYLQTGIDNPSDPKTYVSDLEPGVHQFLFTVIDNNGAVAHDTINITVIDTLTNTGKEYIFPDQIWSYAYYFDLNVNEYQIDSSLNAITINDIDLFYNPVRNIEVSILVSGSATWQIIPKSSPALPRASYSYSVNGSFGYSGLSVGRTFLIPSNDLYGTKVSVKVKFL